MAQYTTEAVILGVKNWGDADKMLQFFSRDRGKIKAAAFGCRRPKSALAGSMQMFNVVELSLTEGHRVDTVRQAVICRRFPHLETDLTAMAYASFVAELLIELEPEGEANRPLYDWLSPVLSTFGERNPRLTALAAGYQLMAFAGVGSKYEGCIRCGRDIEGDAFLSTADGGVLCPNCAPSSSSVQPFSAAQRTLCMTLASLDWVHPMPFRVKREELLEAEEILLSSLRQLLGKELKSLAFIRQLGASA
ncbi:MAG: DNA repair protein RecO [Schwartzia sp. (in: firmicutes)]